MQGLRDKSRRNEKDGVVRLYFLLVLNLLVLLGGLSFLALMMVGFAKRGGD